jgi:ribosomal RNA-processing protein 8
MIRNKSKLSELHKQYKTLNSNNLHKLFNNKPELWEEYHEIAEQNEKGFVEQDEVPFKRIIRYLENMKIGRKKYIVDLGCGKARVSKYFKDNELFKFYNYDHYNCNDNVISCDIKEVPLEDNTINIAILCLSMWGSNCKDYIKETSRILEDNGILLIIEPMKRWLNDDNTNRLEKLIEENDFQIKKRHNMDKFIFLECTKC